MMRSLLLMLFLGFSSVFIFTSCKKNAEQIRNDNIQEVKSDLQNQINKDDTDKNLTDSGSSNLYTVKILESDFKSVDVVVYVNVLSRKLADQIGEGNCEEGKGTGYCLYLLKAEVKEVFKGKIETKVFEFYTSTDLDYSNKDLLLGEKVVFLNQSDNYPDKKMSLGTLENSTRQIKDNVIEKIREISTRKTN